MIDKILTFITVVEKASLVLAAQVLGTSLSSVSRSISALEDQLGAKLLPRNNKEITLTEFGTHYYTEALILASKYNELEVLCSTYARELSGWTIGDGGVNRIGGVYGSAADLSYPVVTNQANGKDGVGGCSHYTYEDIFGKYCKTDGKLDGCSQRHLYCAQQ